MLYAQHTLNIREAEPAIRMPVNGCEDKESRKAPTNPHFRPLYIQLFLTRSSAKKGYLRFFLEMAFLAAFFFGAGLTFSAMLFACMNKSR